MKHVKILNGGTIEWAAFNDLEQKANKPSKGDVTLTTSRDIVAEWNEVYDQKVGKIDSLVSLLDARPHALYTGEKTNHSIAAGHIPGAINAVSLDATDAQSQTWLDDDALAKFYAAVPKDHPVIIYDIGGFRASLAYVHLKHLGYKNLKIYNGGWDHWGNTQYLPAVKGEEPYGEEFEL